MKISPLIVSLTAFAVSGCTQGSTASRSPVRPDYFRNRVTYTGSNIPQPRNQIPDRPLSATAPVDSFAREYPSFYPTDPVVGANAGPVEPGSTGPNRNVGAGPAGSASLPGSQ